jgi:hypothetical protein
VFILLLKENYGCQAGFLRSSAQHLCVGSWIGVAPCAHRDFTSS